MKRRFFALFTMFALCLGAVTFLLADSSSQTGKLAANLPNSDGVVVVDAKRLMNDELPRLLASGGKIEFLNEVNEQIDLLKNQTGINLRNFEQIAVGVRFKEVSPGKLDYEPIALARGNAEMKADVLLAAAKLASKGKYREEKNGAKTVYVFATGEIFRDAKPTGGAQQGEDANRKTSDIPAEIAVAAFDDNTLIIGTPARVSETLSGTSRVAQNILSLVERKPSAIMSFGAKMPANASKFFKLGDPEIDKTIDSIELASGTVDLVGGNAAVSVAAKTYQPEQAKNLHDTLEFLRSLGTGFLGSSQGADKQVYGRMVESAKIARTGSEITLDMQISNSDLSQLLGKK